VTTAPTIRELSKAGTTLGQAGGRARFEQLREEFSQTELSDYFAELGRKSGKARKRKSEDK
jgi:hypothetical protein